MWLWLRAARVSVCGGVGLRRQLPCAIQSLVSANGGTAEGRPRAAEFFAGIGLVRMALEQAGFRVVYANDVDAAKHAMYARNFGDAEFTLADIRSLDGGGVPDVELATASFPCTDLSLAGARAGLSGRESGLVAEFLRILREMEGRRPPAVLIENVPGFGSSNGGADLRHTLAALNGLGYACDVTLLDARRFVPQSRARLFIVGAQSPPAGTEGRAPGEASLRPNWMPRLAGSDSGLRLFSLPHPAPPEELRDGLDEAAERFPPEHEIWWGGKRLEAFLGSLSPINAGRAAALRESARPAHATAYRRTRRGRSVWEIRADCISGCLRTTRGGSSRQALVEGCCGALRVRWMTAREYARLQGAPDFDFGSATEAQATFAMGDAVCVPAVCWLAEHYLLGLWRCPRKSGRPTKLSSSEGDVPERAERAAAMKDQGDYEPR